MSGMRDRAHKYRYAIHENREGAVATLPYYRHPIGMPINWASAWGIADRQPNRHKDVPVENRHTCYMHLVP